MVVPLEVDVSAELIDEARSTRILRVAGCPAHARVLTAVRESSADQAEIEARDIVQRAHLDILCHTGRSRRSGASD
jgi:hypothetical protein